MSHLQKSKVFIGQSEFESAKMKLLTGDAIKILQWKLRNFGEFSGGYLQFSRNSIQSKRLTIDLEEEGICKRMAALYSRVIFSLNEGAYCLRSSKHARHRQQPRVDRLSTQSLSETSFKFFFTYLQSTLFGGNALSESMSFISSLNPLIESSIQKNVTIINDELFIRNYTNFSTIVFSKIWVYNFFLERHGSFF